MNLTQLYMFTGVMLFALGLFALFSYRHLLRQVLAVNVMSSGVFMMLIAAANRAPDASPDPVPHAMVLTGIVLAVSATALALSLVVRLQAATGSTQLSEEESE